MAELTDAQILALLRGYLKLILEEDENSRIRGKKDWMNSAQLDDHIDDMAYLQHDCHRELAVGNFSRAIGAVGRLLEEHGVELERNGPTYEKLCREMIKVMINYLEIDIRRTRLNYSLDDLPFPEFLPVE
jgi:hypothetical protein